MPDITLFPCSASTRGRLRDVRAALASAGCHALAGAGTTLRRSTLRRATLWSSTLRRVTLRRVTLRRTTLLNTTLLSTTLLAVACSAPSAGSREPTPESSGEARQVDRAPGDVAERDRVVTALPAVPAVRGPISIRGQHPPAGTLLDVDSTFVFGTVSTGDATLRINGVSVPVASNGAFLAYLAVPQASFRPINTPVDSGAQFVLEAARQVDNPAAADSVRTRVRIRRPAAPLLLPDTGVLRVDSASVQPRSAQLVRAGERVRVSVRAPANATAWVRASDNRTIPLVRRGDAGPTGQELGATFVGEARASQLGSTSRLVIARGSDTVRLGVKAPDTLLTALPARYGVLRSTTGGLVAQSDTDQVVIARPVPDGFYKWSLLPGTQLEITGSQGSEQRVRFDSQLETWVSAGNIELLPEGTPDVSRVSGGLRVVPFTEYVDVIIPTGARPAFLVEPDDATLRLTLYNTQLSPSISPMIGTDPLVRQLAWEPVASDRTQLDVRLSAPVFGWQTLWDEQRRALVLRVRRVPEISTSSDQPLAGLTLVVDAGHPPGGATGPTGLTEADAVLPISQMLERMLIALGANVVMTRSTPATVDLTDRPVIARRANAHAFLSVHLNAFGDGTNPFINHGTSTLFFHQPSEPLARAIQQQLMKQIGQRDIGIHYQNLAIARPTWFPSALAEGLFLMFPDQEAAMRNPEWQARYARGMADGVINYFRELARRTTALQQRYGAVHSAGDAR